MRTGAGVRFTTSVDTVITGEWLYNVYVRSISTTGLVKRNATRRADLLTATRHPDAESRFSPSTLMVKSGDPGPDQLRPVRRSTSAGVTTPSARTAHERWTTSLARAVVGLAARTAAMPGSEA